MKSQAIADRLLCLLKSTLYRSANVAVKDEDKKLSSDKGLDNRESVVAVAVAEEIKPDQKMFKAKMLEKTKLKVKQSNKEAIEDFCC